MILYPRLDWIDSGLVTVLWALLLLLHRLCPSARLQATAIWPGSSLGVWWGGGGRGGWGETVEEVPVGDAVCEEVGEGVGVDMGRGVGGGVGEAVGVGGVG